MWMPVPAFKTSAAGRTARVGWPDSTIRPPFHCDYGFNLSLGTVVFLKFGCVILDVVEVSIGDLTQIGPNAQILTADHPRNAAEREAGLEFGRPIRIGRNVWIGGGAIILPGVTVGDGAVIGAGSVGPANKVQSRAASSRAMARRRGAGRARAQDARPVRDAEPDAGLLRASSG